MTAKDQARGSFAGTSHPAASVLRALLLVLLAFVMGCGGGGSKGSSTADRGGVTFTVQWPARSGALRVIPQSADSIRFTFVPITTKPNPDPLPPNPKYPDLRRPPGDAGGTLTYTRKDIPSGKYTVYVEAHSDQDNPVVPTAIAVGNGTIDIRGDETKTITVTLRSNVTSLKVESVPVGAASLPVGGTTTLKATPLGGQESTMIVVAPSTVTWKSSDPTVATVDATGLTPTVHALKKGSVTFTATFSEVEPTLGQTPVASTPFSFSVASANYLYHVEGVETSNGHHDRLIIVRSSPSGVNPTTIYSPAEGIGLYSLRVSPDGSRIVFFQAPDQGPETQAKVVVIDPNGFLLSSFAAPNGADPLALGLRYLYHVEGVATPDGHSRAIVVRSEPNGADPVTIYAPSASTEIYSLSASPDGSRIALLQASESSGNSQPQVVVINPSGTVLSSFAALNGADPLSLGPTYLYHVESIETSNGHRDQEIVVRSSPSGVNPVTIYAPAESIDLYSLSASADGSRIAFFQAPDGGPEDQAKVVVIDLNGTILSSFAAPNGADPLALGP